jgi:membrane protein implicated in regulation of membrane protease activity
MQWSPPVLWALIGLGLIALEAILPGFVIMFFGLGALITALAAWIFDIPLPWQALLFAAASVASLVTLRGTCKKIFQGGLRNVSDPLGRMGSFIGTAAIVTENISRAAPGRIKARGSFYAAVADSNITAGETVRIIEDVNGDHTLFKVAREQ